MARESVIYQIFLASPSDVAEERAILETVVTQLNQIWSSTLGISFEVLKWETNVRPIFSDDPQHAINEQIALEYDVFIGIFWGRIGTPTPRAESGSIEEFNRAYSRFKSTENTPQIMIYFKDAPIAPSRIDVDQLKEVKRFRESLPSKGGLYSVFEDLSGFESSLRAHLSMVAQNLSTKSRRSHVEVMSQTDGAQIAHNYSEEDDYGYIDYIEIYESRLADMIAALTVVNEATVRIGEQLTQRAQEFNIRDQTDSKDVRRHIKRAADDITIYAEIVSTQNLLISASRKEAFAALSNALALQSNFSTKDEEIHGLKGTLVSLIESTFTAKEGITSLRTAADSLPRISKELNKAKRIVVTELDLFIAEIDNVRSTVNNILESIDRIE
ncbi:hypothetical protein [Undibacterium sp. Ji49W]|uniref:hypothetical protein n=1 Tax=Undibacterium sp. Ji49W TaxID=3413040 RepID=UPI003BF26323